MRKTFYISIGLLFLFSCEDEKTVSVTNEDEKTTQIVEEENEVNEFEQFRIESQKKFEKLYNSLKKEESYLIKDSYPEQILGGYILLKERNVTENYSLLGYYKDIDKNYLRNFDSLLVFENNIIELKNNIGKILYKKWGDLEDPDSFTLISPDTTDFWLSLEKDTTGIEAVELYLNKYYTKSSKRKFFDDKHLKMGLNTCAFVQIYDNQIVFSDDNCSESGGAFMLSLPKINTTIAKEFIELMFGNDIMNNIWVTQTKYEPVDGGVGCYYEIEQTENRTIINNTYCGC